MVRMYTPEELRKNPQLFMKLMEEYNISPRELGIKPAYKSQIKSGYRKPSLELCKRLIQLIYEKRRPDPSLGRLRGLADNNYLASNGILGENYLAPAKSFHYLETSQQDNMELILIQTISLITTPSFREGLRDYMFSRYVRDDARLRYNYLYKNIKVLIDPAYITKLTPSQAKHLLNGIAALRDYLRLIGYRKTADTIDDYLKQLRKIAPKPQKIKVLDYEIDTSIIDKGLKELKQIKAGKLWKILALISFFTGLRGTEIVFLWNNWKKLRKIYHNDIVIIELGYNRKSKKAWITLLPLKLAEIIDRYVVGTITYTSIQNLRDKVGFHVGLMRKVHLAILSETMMEHEIKLLQGRVSEITVKHYTRHLREIARKYYEAYKDYLTLLEEL